MSALIDLVLCAFLGASTWGASTLTGPLAAAAVGAGLGLVAWWMSRRPLTAAVPAIGIALVGAHAIAAGPPPVTAAWLAQPGGVAAIASILLVLAALATREGRQDITEPILAGAGAVVLLLAVSMLLGPFDAAAQEATWWRPLMAAAAGVAQALSLLVLLRAAPRRRVALCAVALVAAGVVALVIPGSSAPLRAPVRTPFVVR